MMDTKDTARTIEQKIKAEAMRLGFSLCGITDVQPPREYARYESWLERGFQAGMTYLTAIANAGGDTYRAKQDFVFVIRGDDPEQHELKLSVEEKVQPGDIIRVAERLF